jgi:hypothetical protein
MPSLSLWAWRRQRASGVAMTALTLRASSSSSPRQGTCERRRHGSTLSCRFSHRARAPCVWRRPASCAPPASAPAPAPLPCGSLLQRHRNTSRAGGRQQAGSGRTTSPESADLELQIPLRAAPRAAARGHGHFAPQRARCRRGLAGWGVLRGACGGGPRSRTPAPRLVRCLRAAPVAPAPRPAYSGVPLCPVGTARGALPRGPGDTLVLALLNCAGGCGRGGPRRSSCAASAAPGSPAPAPRPAPRRAQAAQGRRHLPRQGALSPWALPPSPLRPRHPSRPAAVCTA